MEATIKFANFVFALVAFGAGLVAAWNWYRASKVGITPLWAKLGTMEPIGGSSEHWVIGIMDAAKESGSLNASAAIWTAVSVAGASFTSLISAWPFSN